MLASIFFLNLILNEKINSELKLYFLITLLTFFSSLCLYFDQKLLIIPLIVLFKILRSKINLKFKIFSLINYCIFAVPFLYLLILWKGLVSPASQQGNVNTITSLSRLDFLWLEHIGYATTIIAFYLLPLLLFKNKNLYLIIKNFFSTKNNYVIISFFFVYLIYLLNFFDYREFTTEKYWIGLGYIHKTSLLLFKSYLLQEIFTYLAFFISWMIILIFIEKNLNDFLIIFYFYFLSLLLWPLMHEYFDPIILLMAFTIFSTKLFINYKNSLFLFVYLSIFLISANIYYFLKVS